MAGVAQESIWVRYSGGTPRPWLLANGQQFTHVNCTEIKQNKTKQSLLKQNKTNSPNPENLPGSLLPEECAKTSFLLYHESRWLISVLWSADLLGPGQGRSLSITESLETAVMCAAVSRQYNATGPHRLPSH